MLLAFLSIALTVIPQSVARSRFSNSLADSWFVYVQYFGAHFSVSVPVMLSLLFVMKKDEAHGAALY